MQKFIHFYYANSTIIGVILFIVVFVAINIFYLSRKRNKFLHNIFHLSIYWLPFLITIGLLLLINNGKSTIIEWAENKHKVEIQDKWYFILLSSANNILLFWLTVLYFKQTSKLKEYYYAFIKKHTGNLLTYTCLLCIVMNLGIIFLIYQYIKNVEDSLDILVITQVASIINMLLFFLIDFIVLKLSNRILQEESIYLHQNLNIKEEVIGIKKTASFAIFNIDLACLLGVVVVIIVQNEFLNITDTIYEYPFVIGSVFFQIVITQIIFALYQSKRLTNTAAVN